MSRDAEDFKAATELRNSVESEDRATALMAIMELAFHSSDIEVRSAAIDYLHRKIGVAVITDPPQPPVIATVNGVHVEHRHAL